MSEASETFIESETKLDVTDDVPTKSTKEEEQKSENLIEKEKEIEIKENGVGVEAKEKEWEDLLGSGSLMKKVVREGKADSRPQRLERCLINYECTLEDGELVEKKESFGLLLGDCEVRTMFAQFYCTIKKNVKVLK